MVKLIFVTAADVGAKLTTTVQLAPFAKLAPQVPPVPGKPPPLKVTGGAKLALDIPVPGTPPEFSTVNVLSVDDPIG